MSVTPRRCMILPLALAGTLACSRVCEEAPPIAAATLQAAVDTLLDASAASWNAGELDGFLRWYARSPQTTFMGARGLLHGWETIRERYAPAFASGAARDSLRFEELETRPLAARLGLATARYVLFQGDSIASAGVFTLVVELAPDGWRIVHDHSSASAN